MLKTKMIVLVIAAAVLAAAIVGVAFGQFASAQTNQTRSPAAQTPVGSGSVPQQGYYRCGPSGYGYCYGYGGATGMCGRFW